MRSITCCPPVQACTGSLRLRLHKGCIFLAPPPLLQTPMGLCKCLPSKAARVPSALAPSSLGMYASACVLFDVLVSTSGLNGSSLTFHRTVKQPPHARLHDRAHSSICNGSVFSSTPLLILICSRNRSLHQQIFLNGHAICRAQPRLRKSSASPSRSSNTDPARHRMILTY